MVKTQTIFSYKTIKGLLHKIPTVIKLLLLPPLSILCLYLPALWNLIGIIIFICAAFISGLSIQDQLTDFKPAALYIIILYLFSVISNIYDCFTLFSSDFLKHPGLLLSIFIPSIDYIRLTLRLILILQMSALVFRTTSSLEIRNAVRIDIISLFIGFIPDIFKTWSSIDIAWKARNGKNGIKKIMTLIFILITISFEKASVKSKALEERRNRV